MLRMDFTRTLVKVARPFLVKMGPLTFINGPINNRMGPFLLKAPINGFIFAGHIVRGRFSGRISRAQGS